VKVGEHEGWGYREILLRDLEEYGRRLGQEVTFIVPEPVPEPPIPVPPTPPSQGGDELMGQISAVLDKAEEGIATAVRKEFKKAKGEIAAIIEADANTQPVQDGQEEALNTLLKNFSESLNKFLD